MPVIDRGEGHPANLATEAPQAAAVPAEVMAGMVELAERVREQRVKLGAWLVLEHGPGVVEALRQYTAPSPEYMPSPRLEMGADGAGRELSYLQIGFRLVPALGPGEWRLVRDGEIVADGVLGVCQDDA
jgi:hypothetical protein